MKNLKHILSIILISWSLGTALGYASSSKEERNNSEGEKFLIYKKDKDNNIVKIALLLDTSNSMDGLINQAKAQLWDIVNQFSYAKCGSGHRPALQIALYQYGNDGLSSKEGYIQQVIGFSSDLDEISEKLFSLSTNGGEEYCGEVIQTSLRQLDWGKNPDNLKMI
uniref:VWA domain-containing protein n=1 Tax=uncultured Eudoraea sp. TaxID=1035614 RepID=UPI00260707B4